MFSFIDFTAIINLATYSINMSSPVINSFSFFIELAYEEFYYYPTGWTNPFEEEC